MATCTSCKTPMLDGGYIRPTPARERKSEPHPDEGQYLKFTQGGGGMTVEAMGDEHAVCSACYIERFKVCYPDASVPKIPDNRQLPNESA